MAAALGPDCHAKQQDQLNAVPPASETETAGKSTTGKIDLDSKDSQDDALAGENALGMPLLKNIWSDQKAIWLSPIHLRWDDGSWLFPSAVVIGGFFATDRSVERTLPKDPNTLSRYRSMSNYGLASLAGVGGGLYLWSTFSHDDHQRETGLLAGEAAIDSFAVSTALQYSLGREQPYQDQGRGTFLPGGTSFPSDHAVLAWSIASVIAHEYPGPLTQLFAYGMAAGVSASRVMGQEHFPSDVLVGSAIGWLIGREVYHAHHDPNLTGTALSSLSGNDDDKDRRDTQHMGSPFVPLDSWVYPAFERLAALGYIDSAIMGLKPWTRLECARLTDEASDALAHNDALNSEAVGLQSRLREEFAYELKLMDGERNLTANLESVYFRAVSISGPALTDSYHFGQTIADDFGRPFERGTNGQAGGSFSAAAGPLTMYVRTEYQHAPSSPAYSSTALNAIALRDGVPLSEVASGATSTINRPELLDAYAAVNLSNWQLAVGRQSLSWTPGPDGSMLWSNNIQPIDMIRLVNPEPFRLPGFLEHVGPFRIYHFFGQLDGDSYISRHFIYGKKINVKVFPFLELGFGRTVTIGGAGGGPITLDTLAHSYVGLTDPHTKSVPGDAHAEMDWNFYVPGVRNYVVLYGDAYADDDFLPIQNPARNPWHPGLYITRFPGIPKLDFHIEGVSTEQQGRFLFNNNQGEFNYWNQTYRGGYTNEDFLIGNAVGRDGRTIQSWFTYWISPRNTLQFVYMHNTVAADFIPGGGASAGLRREERNVLAKRLLCEERTAIRKYLTLSGSCSTDHKQTSWRLWKLGFGPRRKKKEMRRIGATLEIEMHWAKFRAFGCYHKWCKAKSRSGCLVDVTI